MIKDQELDNSPSPKKEEKKAHLQNKRGVFPRLPFKKVLEFVTAIHEIGQGEPVRRLKIFDFLGKAQG